MTDPSVTMQKLRSLAAGRGAEADTAAAILAELELKYPDAAGRDCALSGAEAEEFVGCRDEYEQQLIARLARYLSCEAYRTKNGQSAKWRRGLLIKGPRPFVVVAKAYAPRLLDKVREVLLATAVGFSWGALPIEEDSSNKEGKPLTADQRAAAAAAFDVGVRNQPRQALTSGLFE